MAAWRSATSVKVPRRMAWRGMMPKEISTMFSHEQLVGAKCRVMRGFLSLFHEAKAAGIIYQAVLRHELHAELGFEWHPVDAHSGMAEIAGVVSQSIKAWS